MKRPPLDIVTDALRSIDAYRTKPDPAPARGGGATPPRTPPVQIATPRSASLRSERAIKLDANESPWPLPDEARARLAEVLGEAPLHRYPDLLARDVRRAVSARTGAPLDELVLGVGSDEVIGVMMAALGQPRRGAAKATVLYPTPTFVMYPITCRVHGLEPVEVPLRDDWSLDVDATVAAIERHRPNLIFLATPNNPTGNAFEDAALEAVIAAAPDALVVLDEAYAPFSGRSLGDWVERHPNVAVLGTVSKMGLAGLRLGWGRLHPELAAQVDKARPPYNLSLLTQLAARVLLSLGHVLDAQVERIVEERERLGAALGALDGVKVFSSQANFFLIELDDAEGVHRRLLERGVQVRHFATDPRLRRHLRVTVGTPDEDDRFLEALAEALSEAAR